MRASTSASHACGSTSLRRAVAMSVYMNAARSPPRSEPANSHDFLPRAMPLSARSAALFVRQMRPRSEEHTSELQSLIRISYAVFCLKKKQAHLHDQHPEEKSTEVKDKNKANNSHIQAATQYWSLV